MPDNHHSDDAPADRDVEVIHDRASFAAEMRRLADALQQGAEVTVDVDGEPVAVPLHARLSVTHEREDGEVELEFVLSWSASGDDAADHGADDNDDQSADDGANGEADDAAPKVASA